jgi:hypothetical protein
MDDAIRKKILAQREEWVTTGRLRFLVRRPAELVVARLRNKNRDAAEFVLELVRAAVVGWDGVDEATLFAGGGDQPIPFDSETFIAWVEDQPDVYGDLAKAVLDVIQAHKARQDAVEKN